MMVRKIPKCTHWKQQLIKTELVKRLFDFHVISTKFTVFLGKKIANFITSQTKEIRDK
jgi:hypothetical protein